MKLKQRIFFLLMVGGIPFFAFQSRLYADDVQNINYIERGVYRIFTSVFQLPIYLVQKTLNGPPLVGTIDGALTGTFYTVSSLLGGTFDIARGTVPYGKYMLFFL